MDRIFPATWITADFQVQSPPDQITPPPSTNSEAGFRYRQALVEKHFSTWLVTFNQQIIFRAIRCFYYATLIIILYNIHAVY